MKPVQQFDQTLVDAAETAYPYLERREAIAEFKRDIADRAERERQRADEKVQQETERLARIEAARLAEEARLRQAPMLCALKAIAEAIRSTDPFEKNSTLAPALRTLRRCIELIDEDQR